MAEAIARRHILGGSLAGRDLFAATAGVSAMDGMPISRESIEALSRLGIEHTGVSKQLTPQMIQAADLVLGMTAAHVDAARQLVDGDPDAMARIMVLDPDGDIEDPIGQEQAVYDAVAERLGELIPQRLLQELSI